MMEFFSTDFYNNAMKLICNKDYMGTVKQQHFPSTRYNDEGDYFYKELWKQIDNSTNYCWILTYAMDDSLIANTTFRKLMNASRRGVDVVLFVDDLQQYTNKNLVQKLQQAGGKFVSLNPTWRQFWHIPTQEFFRRHHEKLSVIDDKTIIGSANIEGLYGGVKYGSQTFYDFNLFATGYINTEQFSQHFMRISEQYDLGLQMHQKQTEQPLKQMFTFIRTHQPAIRQIQENILNSIDKAQEKIVMVQPYYYPVRRCEQKLIQAMERGVQVELITSAKRDQPVYHYIKNYLLLRNLFHPNIKIYEYPEHLLHMKCYLIDNKKFNIGSFNNDRWSWLINNEANIIIEDKDESAKVQTVIDKCKDYCRPIEMSGQLSAWRYTKIQFWELFLYLSEIMMSKNKYSNKDKHRYKNIPSVWDDSLGNDF